MPRGTGRRTWVKLHTYGRLHGSLVYQLEEAEQSVWDKLLCLAGEINREGQISDNDGRSFPHEFIANEIHTSIELLESTFSKCRDEGRITEDAQGIHITNWKIYQSEYQRQKPYRQVKSTGKPIHKVCPDCNYKALTSEVSCPKCFAKGKDVLLEKDFHAGKYGNMVHG